MSDMSFIREELNAMYEVRNRFMELEQQIMKSETYPKEHIQELNTAVTELSTNILPLIEKKLYQEFELRKKLLNAELDIIAENIMKEINRNDIFLDSIQMFLEKTFGKDGDSSGDSDPFNPPKPSSDRSPKGFFFGGMK